MKKQTKSQMGKKSRASGARFELKVRKDLENKGWVVDRWTNNVEFTEEDIGLNEDLGDGKRFVSDIQKAVWGKLIPAKTNRFGMRNTGFPDFIAFKKLEWKAQAIISTLFPYDVMAVECKSNDYLDKTEKTKCKWLLKNKIFSKILIASKGIKRGEIKYKEFKK